MTGEMSEKGAVNGHGGMSQSAIPYEATGCGCRVRPLGRTVFCFSSSPPGLRATSLVRGRHTKDGGRRATLRFLIVNPLRSVGFCGIIKLREF